MLGIDPIYFLYDMSMKALGLAWEGHERESRDRWEQTRHIAYNTARPYLKGEPSMVQFMPFDWDKEKPGEKKDSKPPSKERFDELKVMLNLN